MNPKKSFLALAILVAFGFVLTPFYKAYSSHPENVELAAKTLEFAESIKVLPEMPIEGCRGGRAKLYDECGSQVAIFEAARGIALAEGKTLLVSVGAEWCIWCHVFKAYIKGEHSRFTHTYSDGLDQERFTNTLYERSPESPALDASRVAQFFSENFVLVHIEYHYTDDGPAVLINSLAEGEFSNAFPFIYSVGEQGQFVTSFNSGIAETRRDTLDWFRGYDRTVLLTELQRLRAGAMRQ